MTISMLPATNWWSGFTLLPNGSGVCEQVLDSSRTRTGNEAGSEHAVVVADLELCVTADALV
jgi:hypothetical protein